MRKLIALLAAGMLVLSLVSCGGEEDPDTGEQPGDDVYENENGGIELPPVDVFPAE